MSIYELKRCSKMLPSLARLTLKNDSTEMKRERSEISDSTCPLSEPLPKTLSAKLLKIETVDDVTEWSMRKMPQGLSFLSTIQFLREYTKHPSQWHAIDDLTDWTSSTWEQTRLIHASVLCMELTQASRLLGDFKRILGTYVRRDWSCKKVFVLGDFHGSLHSMLDVLLDMRASGALDSKGKLSPGHAVVCLGDLLDRSPYTLECLYLVLRLARENPKDVVVLAGNHETEEEQWIQGNGSLHEIKGEHNNECPDDSTSMLERVESVTRKLPFSLIAKTPLGIIQFNHGSFEKFDATPHAHSFVQSFQRFVNFEGGYDTIGTFGGRVGNVLQWGDVQISDVDKQRADEAEEGGRPIVSAQDTSTYLNKFGLRMMIRGHNDLANLSLLYTEGTKPSQALNDENSVDVPEGSTYSYFGSEMRDPRSEEDILKKGNVFLRDATDFTMTNVYDLYTLHMAPDAESFSKSLVTETDENPDLLSVTVASCAFAKNMPPVNTMTAYLVIGE